MTAGSLEGRVAIVTGVAGGIGNAIARLFLEEGARVLLTDISSGEWMNHFATFAGRAACRRHDVSQRAQWQQIVADAEKELGPVSILVNNAGISGAGMPLMAESEDLYETTIATNLGGVYHGIQAVVPSMLRAGKGSIVNISSIAGLVASPGLFAYTGSKFGVVGLTKTAAAELGARGIRVNCVHPGVIDTNMFRRGAPDVKAAVERHIATLPMPRLGRPEEIANAVLFLASDKASFCTGVSLPVDGGWTAV